MKNFKNNARIYLVFLVVFACCTSKYYFFNVRNSSDKTIKIFASFAFPDTSLPKEIPFFERIESKGTGRVESKRNWKCSLPSDTISVFVFSKDTLDKYTWEEIKNSSMYIKRYDISRLLFDSGKGFELVHN